MRPCPRTFAVYKPGTPIAGVAHRYRWTGDIPMTGQLRCILCGDTIEPRNRAQEDLVHAIGLLTSAEITP